MTASAHGERGGGDDAVEAQIDAWRGYVLRRRPISGADVDELEDHLRAQIDDLGRGGLDGEEAFLVAIRRIGALDSLSREYAREHSDRLWKQLVLTSASQGAPGAPAWREPLVAIALGAGAGLAVKLALTLFGMTWDAPASEPGAFLRNATLFVVPFLIAYFGWKRRLGIVPLGILLTCFVVLAVALNAYPFETFGDTEVIAALHAPVVLWSLVGVAYTGGRWRSDARRMDFVRFTGEFAIYYVLIALGGATLLALTSGVFALVGVFAVQAMAEWVLPICVPGAVLVAAWLVEAKQDVIENIAPVLTRIFTPVTLAMLVALLAVLATAGSLVHVDRELLILMDAILVLVLCLTLYAISARDGTDRAGLFDALQLAMLVAAIAVNAIMLAAMLARTAEWGFSANKTAALGLNLLLLVHLAWQAWLTLGFLRGRRPFDALARWQTRYLPVYVVWAAAVIVAFPPLFGFA
ncbi:permease prefix domain 1-containing protein [Microbacterium album]|uniref:DUF4153 domain-containing protein n=1 Tax=Microbacterium album TaxID=2053191 RepID=A0A917IDC2_9MICO|nr:permease prefix domain 1-containing protein [Microbacterium album]GGH37827.1 hypothetical protein GCM10010921_08020 [Microbacterium album]